MKRQADAATNDSDQVEYTRERIFAPDSPRSDIEIGNGRALQRRRGGRKKKAGESVTAPPPITGAPVDPLVYINSVHTPEFLATRTLDCTPTTQTLGIAADRNASYKSLMPEILTRGAWQPYAICRDMGSLASAISALAATVAELPTHHKSSTTITAPKPPTHCPLKSTPETPMPTPLALTATDRNSLVTNLTVLARATQQMSQMAAANFTDAVTSSLVHLDNSEIIGHGPLIPFSSTKFDIDRSILTGQSQRSVAAASNTSATHI